MWVHRDAMSAFHEVVMMTTPITVVFVPLPIPIVGSNNGGWLRRVHPAHPATPVRDPHWPLRQPIPVRNDASVRDLLTNARRVVAEDRARRLLQEA
jgi:hypothetical protein